MIQNTKSLDAQTLGLELGHEFADLSLLQDALTHPSLSGIKGQKKTESSAYERLEFLGDRVLGLVIAHWLYELYPAANEGELAKRHASLVNRDALRLIALELDLAPYIRLVHGDSATASRKNLAVLSDAMEAIIGALYLDGGLSVAERFIKKHWNKEIQSKEAPADPKTELQEYAQSKRIALPSYAVVSRSGPAHAPSFEIKLSIDGFDSVTAKGGSKREAEKAAALAMLEEVRKHDKR